MAPMLTETINPKNSLIKDIFAKIFNTVIAITQDAKNVLNSVIKILIALNFPIFFLRLNNKKHIAIIAEILEPKASPDTFIVLIKIKLNSILDITHNILFFIGILVSSKE